MKTRILRPWEKIVGKLLDVKVADDQETIIVNVLGINYILPSFPKVLKSKLSMRGTIVGIIRTENGYAVRFVKKTPSTRTFSAASTFSKEKHRESNVEKIRAVGPDLKQFLKQTSGEHFCISNVIRQALREFVRRRRGEWR